MLCHPFTTFPSEAKYQYRKFLDKSALVASKLGPSRSNSSVGKTLTSPSPERSRTPASTSTGQAVTMTSPAASVAVPPKRPVVSPAHATVAKVNTPDSPLKNPKTNPGLSTSSSSVWSDLSSLATTGQDSSLPLQYQVSNSVGPTQLQTSAVQVNGPAGAMSYPGMGINPFQTQMGFTPSQQPTPSPFTPSVPTLYNNTQSQQPFGQPWGLPSNQQPPLMMQSTAQTSVYQPQPQFSAQLQTIPARSILSHSPNQPFLSAPVGQTQFLSPSPSQQLRSHSPQHQMQPLHPTMPTPAGFLIQNPISAQVNMGLAASMTGMSVSGQPSFHGTTTMQMMQQQQILQQQQAMFGASPMQPMASNVMGSGGNMFGGGQMYSQGSQWGAM